jgi:uncharacterized iron-regulated protein
MTACLFHVSGVTPRRPALALFPVLCLVAVLGACVPKTTAPTQPVLPLEVSFLPQRGEFVSASGDRLSLEQLLELARDKDYILLGEGHKNACDHGVQQRVLAGLAASDTPPVVGLEMVAVDKQPELNDFMAGLIKEDDLEEELDWQERWGYPFSYFRGLFEIIRRNSLPVAGLNVPSRVTRKLSREGMDALTDDERAFLPGEIVPPSNAQAPFLDMMVDQHLSRGDGEVEADNATRRERFHLVQSIWDSKMAEVAVDLHRKYEWPVLVIAGSGHVENSWGIARRISRFEPGAKILLIMPWRGGDFDDESGHAFFYCPETYESKLGATLTDTGQGGLLVEAVRRGSRADTAGLRPGDVLVAASGVVLEHLFDLHRAGFLVHEADQPLVFSVRRGGQTFTVDVGRLGTPKGAGMKTSMTPKLGGDADNAPAPAHGAGGDESAAPAAVTSDVEGGR